MDDIWAKYEGWLTDHFPEGREALNPGAAEQEIANLETAVGAKLPEDYRRFLLRHNGQKPGTVGLLHSNDFLSVADVLGEWKTMKRLLEDGHFPHRSESSPPGAVKCDWWRLLWIPITSEGDGNLECIDLDPDTAGDEGQVIDFDHETVHRCVLASSFQEWAWAYVQDVLAGEYVYSDDYGRLMPIDEL